MMIIKLIFINMPLHIFQQLRKYKKDLRNYQDTI